MKPWIYDDLVTENLIREIENLRAAGIVPLFGRIEAAQLPGLPHAHFGRSACQGHGAFPAKVGQGIRSGWRQDVV
jgi:hypothetical protein